MSALEKKHTGLELENLLAVYYKMAVEIFTDMRSDEASLGNAECGVNCATLRSSQLGTSKEVARGESHRQLVFSSYTSLLPPTWRWEAKDTVETAPVFFGIKINQKLLG